MLLFLPITTLSFLDFVSKLRQSASAFRSLFVDADIPVSVPHTTQSIPDCAIDAFQLRSSHERNFGFNIFKL